MPAPEFAALDAKLDALLEAVRPAKRNRPKDPRPFFNCRLTVEEMAAIDAAAAADGVSRSEFVRRAIGSVIGRVMAPRKEIPDNLRRHNRRKLTHFDDGKTSKPDLDRAHIAREAVRLGAQRQALMIEANAAVVTPRSHDIGERLSEAATSFLPKKGL